MGVKKKIECPYCGYTWKPRVTRPAECPSCRRYLILGKQWIGKVVGEVIE